MRKRLAFALLVVSCVPLAADQNPPALYFGGHRFVVGMSKTDALAALSDCCKLSPPDTSKDFIAGTDKLAGHFIILKGQSDQGIAGTIFFASGKVAEIDRPIDSDKYDYASSDVVGFARALDRALAQDVGDSSAAVRLSAQHVRSSNGDGENLSISFPNGRTVQLQIITLDTPLAGTTARDSVNLNEIVEAPRQQEMR
jgi:hypothetical protein